MAITLKSCYKIKINHCLKGNLFVANIVAGIENINFKSCKTLAKGRNRRKNIKAQERIKYSEILNHVIETKRR